MSSSEDPIKEMSLLRMNVMATATKAAPSNNEVGVTDPRLILWLFLRRGYGKTYCVSKARPEGA